MNKENTVRYPFTKQIMFAKVMEDPELCREFIERLFDGRKVKEILVREVGTVTTEATVIPGVYSKYVRLDVLFEDDTTWYNIELQAAFQKELPQRGRYYSAVLDVTHLEPGKPYGDLKPSYVIFLCLFDYYGLGEAVYTFERYDRKNCLPCGDGSYIIIINTKCPEDKVPESLRPLFHYINTQEVDPEDSFVQTIHDRVLLYQGDKEVAFNMTLEEEYLREMTKAARKGHEDGLAEGHEKGLAEGREKGLAEGHEKGLAEGHQKGLAEGREKGLTEGRAEMQERLNKLNLRMLELGRVDDLQRSFTDAAYQQQLLEEFGI